METPERRLQYTVLSDAEREEFEERAAILEFDAHMTREDAERIAMRLILEKRETNK